MRAILVTLIASAVISTGAIPRHVSAARAAQLPLVSARIHEDGPFEPGSFADRQVVFTLVTADQPACPSEAIEYAFLLDTDSLPTTGVSLAAIPELGIEAKIAIRCDPARRTYISPSGTVSIRPDADRPGASILELRTRLRDLPAVAFRWVAVAKQGDRVVRIPAAGRSGRWQIVEAALW